MAPLSARYDRLVAGRVVPLQQLGGGTVARERLWSTGPREAVTSIREASADVRRQGSISGLTSIREAKADVRRQGSISGHLAPLAAPPTRREIAWPRAARAFGCSIDTARNLSGGLGGGSRLWLLHRHGVCVEQHKGPSLARLPADRPQRRGCVSAGGVAPTFSDDRPSLLAKFLLSL